MSPLNLPGSFKEATTEAASEKTTDSVIRGAATSVCMFVFEVITRHGVVLLIVAVVTGSLYVVRHVSKRKAKPKRRKPRLKDEPEITVIKL